MRMSAVLADPWAELIEPAAWPVSRANRSSDSPRNRRKTTPSLRRALQRTSLLASGSSLRALERPS